MVTTLFEEELQKKGFQLTTSAYDDVCDHQEKNCTFYKQECSCCYIDSYSLLNNFSKHFNKPYVRVTSKELPWYRLRACQKCLDNYLECLFCGGHYENARIFKGDKEDGKDYNFTRNELDPEELVYPDYGT